MSLMRVHVVDPSAYTPPYDHALCSALGEAGAGVELFTSRFLYGPTPTPHAYERRDFFYRGAHGLGGERPAGAGGVLTSPRAGARRALKLGEHVPDMLRYRHAARAADVVHFQWLAVQPLDVHLLPRARPLVLTAHDVLPREPRWGARQLSAQRRLYERMDAVVVHSEHGRRRLVAELGIDAERVHVIAHGALAHLAAGAPARHAPFETDRPVVLCFGLMRPYKGIDVLLEAWRGVEDAELWIAGMPRMDVTSLDVAHERIRFVPRFITDSELPAYFQRADLVVLPYREIDQSGVLFTALAFGKPLLLSDVGGFPEIARTGAARIVPAGDPDALRGALGELLGDPGALAEMAVCARAAAEGPYSWDAIARASIDLYELLIEENPSR
jgi:glycosyltransferase involved in cell wall biosynthesis